MRVKNSADRIKSRQTRPRARIGRRIGLGLILAGLALVLVWSGIKAVRIYNAARAAAAHLQSLQEAAAGSPQELVENLPALAEQVRSLSDNVAVIRAETRFLDGLLPLLGWVPGYGPELAATPHLAAVADDLAAGGADLAETAAAVQPLLLQGGDDSLVQALAVLQDRLPALEAAQARLEHAVYERGLFDAAVLDSGPYAQAAPLLAQADPLLPEAARLLRTANGFLPHLDSALGMAGPRRYLLLGQSNFELRATGGFIGSMGILTVDQGRVVDLDYRRSPEWDNPNREKVEAPIPYVRYMLFGAWFIRDANFYADFPTSAQTVEWFWGLDGHPPVDGVIAVDLYAVENLLAAVGPVAVPGYGIAIGPGGDIMETIWQGNRQDPSFLAAMVAVALLRLQQPDLLAAESLPALLGAVGQSLDEKHILLYWNDPALQEATAAAGWSGAVRQDAGDYLLVVDSDFSWAEVTRFVDQEIVYRTTLDANLRPQESTVTMRYWNHFDRWTQGGTDEPFGGACYDPAIGTIQYFPGCYGDYLRIYVPLGSRFVSAAGFDDGMEYREENGRTVIAGYVRIFPGEHKTVSITYVPAAAPVDGQYHLTWQKQPGTDALPVQVEITAAGMPAATAVLATDLRVDRTVSAAWHGARLVLATDGPVLAAEPAERAEEESFAAGWALWQAGRRDEAAARWRADGAEGLVLDQANLALARGDGDEAAALAGAVLTWAGDSARAYFLLGQAREGQGDLAAARTAWERAVELEPANRSARLALGLLCEIVGDYEAAYTHLRGADLKEATQALWFRVWPHLNVGETEVGLAELELIIRLDPTDANAHFTLADRLRALQRYDEALAAYEAGRRAAPGDVRYHLGRGQLYADQGNGDLALADLEAAVALAPRSAEAWYQLGRLRWRFRQDLEGAVTALEQAAALNPHAGYYSALGDIYREAGDLAAAVAAYEVAARMPGRTARTWALLGSAYAAQENWRYAADAYGEAVALEPGNAQLHASRGEAYARSGRPAEAIAAYEAALTLQPGQTAWMEALARLKE